jgi:hypothetical protein
VAKQECSTIPSQLEKGTAGPGGTELVHMMRKGQAKYACAQQLSLAEQVERLAA